MSASVGDVRARAFSRPNPAVTAEKPGATSGDGEGEALKILVVGAAGMIGRKLCERLARDGALAGKPIAAAHFVDIVPPSPPAFAAFPVSCEAFDVAAPYVAPKLITGRPDVVFLLASVVSGEAESDFDKGYAINLDGARLLFEAIRREHGLSGGAYRPRLVFTSSIAVFGAPFPETIDDDFFSTPLTSYGTQKAVMRIAARRLFAARLFRRRRIAPADDMRAPRPAQSRRVRLLLGHHSRAAGGARGDPAGRRHGAPLARLAALGGRVSPPRGRARPRRTRRAAQSDDARRFGDRRRADRGVARRRRRGGGEADPAPARRDDRTHRRGMAEPVRRQPRDPASASPPKSSFAEIIRVYREDDDVGPVA